MADFVGLLAGPTAKVATIEEINEATALGWSRHSRTLRSAATESGGTSQGKGLARIVTLVERKSGFVRLRRVPVGAADTVARAVVHELHPLRSHVRTLTWDNGSEFAEHQLIDLAVEATSYFADPYTSRQRGCNENLNGLLRQYRPKGCELGAITDAELQVIED